MKPIRQRTANSSRYLHPGYKGAGSFWCLFLISLLMVFPLYGGTTGKISGIVKDKSTGEPIVGANIYIDGQPFGSASDADGYYFIINIPPGSYTLVAQMVGYQEIRVTNVRVNVDLTTKVNFQLSPETIEGEEVVVVADR
ncbi:MAG: carboxypeptidase-like regulatory domain-containing protein, partial [Calditrichaeota bacterium]